MYDVSIIIPVYNIGLWLPRCLQSIIEQVSFEKTEVLLIDDGSSDESGNLCDKYASKYKNIVSIHKKNGGVSSARNKGLENATGKYVAFVDADDYVGPCYLEHLLTCAASSNADLIVADYYLEFTNGHKSRYRLSDKNECCWNQIESIKEFLKGGSIGINLFDKLFIRDKIGDLRFDERIKIGEDLYFIFQYLTTINMVYADYKPIYNYFQRDGSAMNTTFSEKYFDVIDVSEKIEKWVRRERPEITEYAEAMCIHSAYKTLERCYKANAFSEYKNKMDMLSEKVHAFPLKSAWKNLSRKQFLGFALIRISPKLYIFVCRIMKI